MKLSQHIYLLSGFCYGIHQNVYGVLTPHDTMVLIDTGTDEKDLAIINDTLKFWELNEKKITHVLITHSHYDHCGNAHLFRQNGARIIAGETDAGGIETGDERTINYAFASPFPVCKVDQVITQGDLFLDGLTFTCHSVPGHSSGSTVYEIHIDGITAMFTGDFIRVSNNCEEGKLGWTGAEDFDPKAYLASLRKMKDLSTDFVLGGHFQPCLKNGSQILKSAYKNALLDFRWPSVKE